jgi:acetyl-CoA C-acetyltransferase
MPLNAYIVEAVRTPGGRRNGKLSKYNPADLVLPSSLCRDLLTFGVKGAVVVNELLARTKIDPAQVCRSWPDIPLGSWFVRGVF